MLDIRELNPVAPGQSEEIRTVFFRAYEREAALLELADFPPLRRTALEIRESASRFLGVRREDTLLAVAELEFMDDGSVNIAGFAVIPEMFRKGVGTRLLRDIISRYKYRVLTVSTARENQPALALYNRNEFGIVRHWIIGDELAMVTLVRRPDSLEVDETV